MLLSVDHVCISGIAVTTGSVPITLDSELPLYGGDLARLERLKKATGLNTRWVTTSGVTALDLGHSASCRLLEGLGMKPQDVGGVVFVTQTPDHFQPCNAALLHGRLSLKKSVPAFDVSLGCSGWVYGLWQASSLIASGLENVLLVAGDTLSLQVNALDRACAPLFGDGVSATLLCRNRGSLLRFELGTDGSGSSAIRVPAGGLRQPCTHEALPLETDAEGNSRHATELHMDGPEVFKFTMREVPETLNALMAQAQVSVEDLAAIYLHQANGFILDTLRRRLKAPAEKMPSTAIGRFGNLSSASIPSVICTHRVASVQGQLSLCCGFGVGLSWGAVLADLGSAVRLPVLPYGTHT